MTTHTLDAPMTTDPGPMARALNLDAVVSATAGLALLGGQAALDELLGIPRGWLIGFGVFMVLYAVDLRLVATRLPRWMTVARLIPPGNGLWVLGSVALVVLGGFDLTTLGVAVVLGQAAIVAGLALAQERAVRT